MRRRILLSTTAVVGFTTIVLGVPLTVTAWLWIEALARANMQGQLQRVASEIAVQESAQGGVLREIDATKLGLLVPNDASLLVRYPTPDGAVHRLEVGPHLTDPTFVEKYELGDEGTLTLSSDGEKVNQIRAQAVAGIGLAVLVTFSAGTLVAAITARRLGDPLQEVADRAARLTRGDFRPDPTRHGISELDRVSDVLDAATVEIAHQLQRERSLVADVSHQLRSRLTAVRLRLDELASHPDPEVVTEAEEAMSQVDRLTDSVDDLVRAARSDGSSKKFIPVVEELSAVVEEWQRPYADAGRELVLTGDHSLRAYVTGSRLREAVSVLVDNALAHGGGTCRVSVIQPRGSHDAERTVCVEVTDDGTGVSDGLAPHIFERGFSGGGSTGVGLALARALVEADGGRLELRRRRPAVFGVFLLSKPEKVARGLSPEPR
ncbi:sensor histidine kinase [Smaragdicoccus niigatensis]|uniref:sensor histidine kinase n=1 Tax=Smaragdicoccus niigatensis TaxID=359359 RepID=UPI000360936D|nr:HAMP domain-containing sensor histidine kinase [Smaragdicoccus niigatensis]